MSHQCDYTLELTFTGPLLAQAPGVLAFGVDTAMQRYQNRPVLNGSLIRGNIRHAMTEFAQLVPGSDTGSDLATNINRWFGMETSDDAYTPNRSGTDFDFFWTLKQPPAETGKEEREPARRTRITLEEESGTVETGALQVIEDCFPSGSTVVFEGQIHARFSTDKEPGDFLHWLGKALDYIPAMGSFKGTGFGKLTHWALTEHHTEKMEKPKESLFPDGKTRIGITLRLDRPFCLGKPRTPESNRIISDEMISGNVIKGVIARQYPGDLQKELGFDELIISHAVPVPAHSARPSPLPLSLARHNGTVMDMASVSTSTAFETLRGTAPSFQPDWKEDEKKQTKTEWNAPADPGRYLVIRTEINRKKGISEENRLFTLECIDPEGFTWCADIELCNIEESQRPAIFARLQATLQQGLTGIGKTKARAEVRIAQTLTPFKPISEELPRWQNNRYIVTLQTAARLLPPDLQLSGVNSHIALKQRYQDYWHHQHRCITLVNYFAQQQLTSTCYHQRKNNPAADCYPEWLTTAGSVFVLDIREEEALQQLKHWNRTGLPAHNNADGSVADWQSTPFLPEHGYGEIIINDPKQLDLLYSPKNADQEEHA